MHFYRNPSGGPSSLVLHSSEWNRLKTQAGPQQKPTRHEDEHIKSMIEKSQAWIRTWPDTVQGCVAQKKKQKEKQHAEEIAAVKAFSKKKVHHNTAEAIQKAKQQIFDESCYGKKLLSALIESKTIEERDAQIQFKKEIQEKEAEIEKKQKTVRFCPFGSNRHTEAKEKERKYLTVQNSKENKVMFEKQKADEKEAKEEEKLADLEDKQLMKSLLDREKEAEENIKLLEKQALEQYAAEHKKAKEERVKWEAEYYAQIEQCRKEQEKLNCKIKQVLQKIHNEILDPAKTTNSYETLKKCQEEEKKSYDTFIEKNNKTGEERAAKRERKAKEKEKKDREKKRSIAEINKTLAEYVRQRQCSSKCFCDRQCFIVKSDRERTMKKKKDDMESKYKEVQPPYFGPCNKLVAALKRREKEPTPWTGAGAAHELFKKNADDTLRECKYKIRGRKVVDEYREYNKLDATTLPIPNYY